MILEASLIVPQYSSVPHREIYTVVLTVFCLLSSQGLGSHT